MLGKKEELAGLPAPISLSLDDARQVAAAGVATISEFRPIYWVGKPADFSVFTVPNLANVAQTVAARF